MSTLFRFLSVVPLPLVHALGACLGWLAWACSPTYRRRFAANSLQAGYRFAQVRAAVGHAGRMVTELPRLWLRDTAVNAVHGAEVVEQAWARGKGILFLTPHLGCFELSVQGAARQWSAQHGPITILYRPAKQAWLAEMMLTARNRSGVQAVPTTLAGVRQMIKALRKGAAVGLLPDQVPPSGQGQWASFFGQDAYTMTLAARLALQTGATVVLARCERLPAGRGYELFFEALPMPLSDQLEQAVVQINQAMEHTIRQCPTQYLWGYGRYKQPRQEAPAAESATEGGPA
ncbi:lysophospholipid acyltransferase family protein [Comamonas aquatica]|uniref:lysophospholipid acyltransferase family protein n=1 Tax=Comamonas aquatica TaxID=225991 RepID=UPI00244CB7E0|nr:lysophospholipid acyltransferase family protein [Comamonas aquatica]MDH0899828.1 lysophospholipid acyltransferase family protein [Comamonas aquatica]MDH1379479.1 lysophospholipid acyltransferase family protein [Comamonas aquatica]MDH1639435.1 lysophospholipid acyltransferase family protein [Comamonas aquatica]